ncbi:MAG: hypothetical protein K0Q66_1512 [Chitinophagaceae bacterium]|jgi:hypothetical protein|nr:hypothetical protein [Chitinophagaceae bacterium]
MDNIYRPSRYKAPRNIAVAAEMENKNKRNSAEPAIEL